MKLEAERANTDNSSDLASIQSILEARRAYIEIFTNLMSKLKSGTHVTNKEMEYASNLSVACFKALDPFEKKLSEGTSEEQETMQNIKKTTPPFAYLEQSYAYQSNQQDNKDDEDDGEVQEDTSFDSDGSEERDDYLYRLSKEIQALFSKNPCKNMSEMLKLYENYDNELKKADKDKPLKSSELLPDDLADVLDLELHRKEKEKKLEDKITDYEETAKQAETYFQTCSNLLIIDINQQYREFEAHLSKLTNLEKEIQVRYEYYLTTKHRESLRKIAFDLQEKKTLLQKTQVLTPNLQRGIAIESPFDSFPSDGSSLVYSSEQGSPFSLRSPSPLSDPNLRFTYEENGPATPIVETGDPSKQGLNLDSPPKKGESLKSALLSPNRREIKNKKVCFVLDPEKDSNHGKQESSPNPKHQKKRSQISESLWFLATLSCTSIVVGIVLLALTSWITSSMGIAGLTCIAAGGITACGLAFFARQQGKSNENRLSVQDSSSRPDNNIFFPLYA